ncbi:DUF3097 family protein [Micromonospora sp. C28SCA-DRY-2]|nr:DUF3097 family protein [Micromonospora sp. C28SCA-DRY-2]MDO3703408.1 DUF3097 family protein [Micromonospora sp. C28SCA-DRY-2]
MERIWGDDLRIEGLVGSRWTVSTRSDAEVRAFAPGPGRRLGVLVDHCARLQRRADRGAGGDLPHVLSPGTRTWMCRRRSRRRWASRRGCGAAGAAVEGGRLRGRSGWPGRRRCGGTSCPVGRRRGDAADQRDGTAHRLSSPNPPSGAPAGWRAFRSGRRLGCRAWVGQGRGAASPAPLFFFFFG